MTKLPPLRFRGVFLLVVAALLLSGLLAIATAASIQSLPLRFGLIVLFVQWVTLCFVACWWLLQRLPARLQGAGLPLLFCSLPMLTWICSWLVMSLQFSAHVADPDWWVRQNVGLAVLCSMFTIWLLTRQQRWYGRIAAEASVRLDALQARIRPHFLFNALNTIAELIHQRPHQAEEAVLDLSDLIRTGLSEHRHHSLAQELELIRGYLRIESLRLGDRLRQDWQLADDVPMELRIPVLLIQPLVENAVVHGIAALPEGGVLAIKLERASFRRLRVVIDNPVPTDPRPAAPGHHLALDNIRQRLGLAYEERAGLKLEPSQQRFRATLTLPLDQPPA